jgi:hypothetical protein
MEIKPYFGDEDVVVERECRIARYATVSEEGVTRCWDASEELVVCSECFYHRERVCPAFDDASALSVGSGQDVLHEPDFIDGFEEGLAECEPYPKNRGAKHDDGKLKLGLIPPAALLALGRVLTHGANKYSPKNYKNVEGYRYLDAALRHIVAFMDGERIDPDSGLSHLDHLLANIAFLVEFERDGKI